MIDGTLVYKTKREKEAKNLNNDDGIVAFLVSFVYLGDLHFCYLHPRSLNSAI